MRLMLCLTVALMLTGCAAFQKPDGTVDPVKVENASHAAATTVSFFGPVGQTAALIIGGLGTIFAAHLRGEKVGWDDKAKDTKPATP